MKITTEIFLSYNVGIRSQEKLEQYIQFCIYNNQQKRIKGKTAHHHILPKSIFNKFSDLKNNTWNGTHLLYSDHYYAHWLLTQALDSYAMLEAFCKMHNSDVKNKRINKEDLIPSNEFQVIKEESYRKRTIEMNKEIEIGGRITTKNIERVNKIRELYTSEFLDDGGNITTNAKIVGAKTNISKQRKIIYEGEEMTIHQMAAIKAAKTRDKMGKYYILYHIDNGIINNKICRSDVVKISRTLVTTTKEKYMGKSNQSKASLKTANKENLIGLYVKEIK